MSGRGSIGRGGDQGAIIGWIVAGLVLWLVAFRAPIEDVLEVARGDIDRSYVFLVPFVSAFLFYLRRSRFRSLDGRGAWAGPLLILAGLAVGAYGFDRDHIALWHAGPVLAFIGILVTVFGTAIVTRFLPAVFVLFLLVPIPGFLRQEVAQPLQSMAAQVTVGILELLAIPVTQSGNTLEIDGRVVAIGAACDGMRLMLPLGLVIYGFVFSLPLQLGARILVLVLSVPVAILCNVLRLVPTSIAYAYAPDIGESVHDIGGWLMIPIAVWILISLLRLATWLDLPVERWRLVGS